MKRTKALLILFILFLSFIAMSSFITPHDPLEQNVDRRLEAPSGTHWMGTDGFGRDQLSRTLIGARNSLATAFIAIALATSLGISIGAISVQRGGIFDLIVQRFIDVTLGIPFLILCIVLIISMESSIGSVGLALGIAFTPQIARFTRASLLAIVHLPYVEAAKLCGSKGPRLFFRHLLPNASGTIVAYVSTLFGVSILAEAGLSFLGLGVPPPYPSLGRMLREGAGLYLEAAPWLTIFPGLVIVLIVFSVMLTADIQTNHKKPAPIGYGNDLSGS